MHTTVGDPVIEKGRLGASYREGTVGCQLSRRDGWVPVIEKGRLGASYREGTVGCQLIGLIPPQVSSQDLDFQRHMSWIVVWCSVKMRDDCSFCCYRWNRSLFKISFHKILCYIKMGL
jgi:hypothetical protein